MGDGLRPEDDSSHVLSLSTSRQQCHSQCPLGTDTHELETIVPVAPEGADAPGRPPKFTRGRLLPCGSAFATKLPATSHDTGAGEALQEAGGGLLWALSSGLNQCQTCTEEKKPENSGWGLGTVARKHPRGYTPLLHGKGDHTQSAHWPLAHPAGSDDAAASTQDPRRPTGCQGSSEDRESLGGCWGQTQPEEHAAGLTVKPVHRVSVGGHLEISFPNQQMAGPGRGGSAL